MACAPTQFRHHGSTASFRILSTKTRAPTNGSVTCATCLQPQLPSSVGLVLVRPSKRAASLYKRFSKRERDCLHRDRSFHGEVLHIRLYGCFPPEQSCKIGRRCGRRNQPHPTAHASPLTRLKLPLQPCLCSICPTCLEAMFTKDGKRPQTRLTTSHRSHRLAA